MAWTVGALGIGGWAFPHRRRSGSALRRGLRAWSAGCGASGLGGTSHWLLVPPFATTGVYTSETGNNGLLGFQSDEGRALVRKSDSGRVDCIRAGQSRTGKQNSLPNLCNMVPWSVPREAPGAIPNRVSSRVLVVPHMRPFDWLGLNSPFLIGAQASARSMQGGPSLSFPKGVEAAGLGRLPAAMSWKGSPARVDQLARSAGARRRPHPSSAG